MMAKNPPGSCQESNKIPNIKDKERILKATRGKERVTYKGVLGRLLDKDLFLPLVMAFPQ